MTDYTDTAVTMDDALRDARQHFEAAPATDWPRLSDTGRPEHACTDLANAYRLARERGAGLLHVIGLGWHFWSGAHWLPDEAAALREAMGVSRLIAAEAAQALASVADEPDVARRKHLTERAEALAAWSRRSESRARIESAQALAGVYLSLRTAALDADPWLLATPDGTVDLHTGQVRPAQRTDFCTRCTGASCAPPGASAPVWSAFLRRIFADDAALIDFVQRLAGMALIGDAAEKDAVLGVMYGSGANGKTTFLEAIRHALGDYAAPAAPGLLMGREQHPTALADLRGRRVVYTSESGEGQRLNEELVKHLTGGDEIKARVLYQNFMTFRPAHTLLLATNHRPSIRGTDHGIWRRLKLVPFAVAIPDSERDPHLPAKLRAEAPEILRWLVDGCLAYQRDGLSAPAAVTAATEGYRAEQDLLSAFIDERCLINARCTVAAGELYSDFSAWCTEAGERPWAQRTFSLRLKEYAAARAANIKDGRTKAQRHWSGIGLVTHGDTYDASYRNSREEVVSRESYGNGETKRHPSPDASPDDDDGDPI